MKNFKIYTILLFLTFSFVNSRAEEYSKIKCLAGEWKFSIGDNMEWKKPNLDDSNWEKIKVPGAWENSGYHGYDGFAWYRISFDIDYNKNAPLYLKLGFIDDADEVYLNGQLIGKRGSFPPNFSTAYNIERIYKIPANLINKNGTNHIAIRVYDEWSAGGILWGDIGLFMGEKEIPVELSLEGKWKFKNEDCNIENIDKVDPSSWESIKVPSTWEDQGYKDYNGYACYVKTFKLDNRFWGKDVVLLLGKIDDFDQVYVNGKFIGQHGSWSENKVKRNHYSFYNEKRGYYIPKDVLNHNGTNTIVVRVHDIGGTGGIYFGEIGLVSQKEYIKYWNKKAK